MSEKDKLNAGEIYNCYDPEIRNRKYDAIEKCEELNAIPNRNQKARNEILRSFLGGFGEGSYVASPFRADCGSNIFIGENVMINYNVTILDQRKVVIGNNVMIAPGVLITAVTHPLDYRLRRNHAAIAKEVYIGNDVWIGGNATILPGVTIGDGAVIGAGAVVAKDVEPYTVVVGVPARPMKKLKP